MAKKTSPTQRSLKYLRDMGYICQVVEKWNPYANIRQDLFGWIDIVAVKNEEFILGIQTTTHSNMKARIEKARGNEALKAWLMNGLLVVHGWKHKKKKHELVEHWITEDDL